MSGVINYVEPFFGSGAVLLGCPGWGGKATAPFPYFGGKSRAADLVWQRFGPALPRVFTVNDINCFVANFWRSVAFDPEAVARWADWPVNECDMHVRHKWLLKMAGLLRARLEADPMNYDAKIAGFWVWGASAWIGSGWCEEGTKPNANRIPSLSGNGNTPDVWTGEGRPGHGRGIHAAGMREPSRQLPDLIGAVGNPGKASGVHNKGMRGPSRRLPDLAGGTQWGTDEPNKRAGRGVHSATTREPSRQLPHLSANANGRGESHAGEGRGVHAGTTRTRLYDIFDELSRRLRYVRVACGDFERILTDAVTHRHGLTGVFLDPEYLGFSYVYGSKTAEEEHCSIRAHKWAREAGQRKDMRIALCGYAGEHDELEALGWEAVSWKAKGGYSNAGKEGNNGNALRERIWFSPACLRPGVDVGQMGLFAGAAR